MKDIIIDSWLHFPTLYKVISNADYISPNTPVPKGKTQINFVENYNFKYKQEITDEKYNNCFIVFPLLNIDTLGDNRNKIFKQLLKMFIEKTNAKKIIIIDVHDFPYLPKKNILDEINYDYILKRNYHKNIVYNDKVKPFHFVDCCGSFDPVYYLINNQLEYNKNEIVKKNNKMWFSGTLWNWQDDIWNVHCNRQKIINEIKKYNILEIVPTLPHKQYLEKINEYKYALNIGVMVNGTRMYEILAQNTILFISNCETTSDLKNHVFPFEDGDTFSEYNFFYSIDDLIKKYNELENDDELYKKVLSNQKYITEKYYNFKYINKLIYKYIL